MLKWVIAFCIIQIVLLIIILYKLNGNNEGFDSTKTKDLTCVPSCQKDYCCDPSDRFSKSDYGMCRPTKLSDPNVCYLDSDCPQGEQSYACKQSYQEGYYDLPGACVPLEQKDW